VLVGKASVSDRPVIVRFHDQEREPLTEPYREFTVAPVQMVEPQPQETKPLGETGV
jgi:hypothetical protein